MRSPSAPSAGRWSSFRTVKQVEENAAAMQHGPPSRDQMSQIAKILGR